MTSASVLRELRELIVALDRRVPQVHRAGEVSIARDAAALRARAVTRIEELERPRDKCGSSLPSGTSRRRRTRSKAQGPER